MKQLNEKVAVVTGAGQGIGKGIALCLAKRGVKVIATGRRLEPIEATIAEIRELGGEGFAMTCDSADRERVFEVVAKAVETYGSIDVIRHIAKQALLLRHVGLPDSQISTTTEYHRARMLRHATIVYDNATVSQCAQRYGARNNQ